MLIDSSSSFTFTAINLNKGTVESMDITIFHSLTIASISGSVSLSPASTIPTGMVITSLTTGTA
jgi:hypothetical protein